MICRDCEHCKSFQMRESVYDIRCDLNGKTNVALEWSESFKCDQYRKKSVEPVAVYPRGNVLITLKCGRDFAVRDESIKSERFLISKVGREGWEKYGDIWINNSDIAAFSYLEDI